MEQKMKLLIINPGSTSTKISVYENEKSLFEKSRFHIKWKILSIIPAALSAVKRRGAKFSRKWRHRRAALTKRGRYAILCVIKKY